MGKGESWWMFGHRDGICFGMSGPGVLGLSHPCNKLLCDFKLDIWQGLAGRDLLSACSIHPGEFPHLGSIFAFHAEVGNYFCYCMVLSLKTAMFVTNTLKFRPFSPIASVAMANARHAEMVHRTLVSKYSKFLCATLPPLASYSSRDTSLPSVPVRVILRVDFLYARLMLLNFLSAVAGIVNLIAKVFRGVAKILKFPQSHGIASEIVTCDCPRTPQVSPC